MKITYYIDTVIPTQRANMVHVMKMCQAFAANGNAVTLYCDTAQKDVDLSAVRKQYAVADSFEIKTAYMSKKLRKILHRVATFFSSWKKAKEIAPDSYAYSRSLAALLFVRNKVTYIYEAHLEPDRLNRQFERAILRHPNCRGLVVISQALKRRYLELFPFFPEEKIHVLHDAADVVETPAPRKAALRGYTEGKNIGYVGSLFPGKCMETLLPLAKRFPQHRFHVVGGTDYWVDYWKTAAREQDVSNVEFYGFVDNSRLGEYYQAFDLCVLPFSGNIYIGKSRRVDIGKWTSPLKLFETMAYGKPMVVSGLATIEEVMTNGEDCLMARPDDIDDWEEKLQTLCDDPALQSRLARAAREKLTREYTWQQRAKRAAGIFEN